MKLNSTQSIICATINFISPQEKYVRNEDTTYRWWQFQMLSLFYMNEALLIETMIEAAFHP